jgi:AraC-like DNA-binding protein
MVIAVFAENPMELLRRFPLVQTRDSEAMGDMLFSTYGATNFEASYPAEFEGRANYLLLNDISLGYCGYGSKAAVEFPEADFVRLQMAIKGRAGTTFGGKTTAINGGQLCVTPANRLNRIDFDADYEQLIVRIKSEVLIQKLSTLLGAKPKQPLRFSSAVTIDHPRLQILRNLMEFLALQLASDAEPLPHLLLQELQSSLVVAFLTVIPHSLTSILNRQPKEIPVPLVRRVEEYIEANSQHSITIEKLTRITGVSARSIFYAFKKTRGYSPFSFVKMVRLKNAKALLGSPDRATSVTGVAFVCGFANLGHFAREYREMFGELPSATLARSRA